MVLDQRFAFAGAALNAVGSGAYLRDTLRGTTSPNRATFFLWGLAPLIAFAAEIHQGVGPVAVITLLAGLLPLSIFLASFVNRHSSWRLGAFDYGCGGLSLCALGLWKLTGRGSIAIIFSILADLFASLPTMVKSYRYPDTETGWAYVAGGVGSATGLLVAPAFNIETVAFPIYLVIVCAILSALTLTPRRFRPPYGLRHRTMMARKSQERVRSGTNPPG